MTSDAAFVPLDPRGSLLGDEVYTVLGEAIIDGRLRPGERLRDIDLAELLGVSRTPVREALQRLERIGLIEVSANRWTRVSRPDAKILADTHEYVALTMGNAIRLAVVRASDDDLERVIAMLDRLIEASAADDAEEIMEAAAAFYACLTRAAGNTVMLTVMREAELAIRRNLVGWQPFIACPVTRTSGYVALRDAILARDPAEAERLLRAQHGFS
jgi:DNA-binding GntR family transcriptional regulator